MNKFSKRHVIYYYSFMSFISYLFIYIMIIFSCIDPETNKNIFFLTPSLYLSVTFIYILIFIITLVFRFLYYKKSFYELRDNEIYVEKGVINKRKSYLDYNKIHAVNKKQNFIQKLFKVSTLLIDSGSTNTAYSAEIVIYEDDDKVNELIKTIDLKQKNSLEKEKFDKNINNTLDIEEERLFTFNSKDKILYALSPALHSSFFYLILFIIAIIVFNFILLFDKSILNEISYFDVILIILSSLVFLILSTFIFGLINAFINDYDYYIYRKGDSINITHGLLQKNFNTFKINKVKAVIINQNLFERLFKYAKIEIEVIGFGEQNNNNINRVLIPICRLDEVNSYLEHIFPKYTLPNKENKCMNHFSLCSFHFLFFFSIIGIFYLLFITFAVKLLNKNIILIVSLSFIIVSIIYTFIVLLTTIFKYNNQGLTIDDNKLVIFNGSFIKKETIILKENLIGITKITTPFRKKKGIYSYIVHFKSNSNFNTVRVDSVFLKNYDYIVNLIKL